MKRGGRRGVGPEPVEDGVRHTSATHPIAIGMEGIGQPVGIQEQRIASTQRALILPEPGVG